MERLAVAPFIMLAYLLPIPAVTSAAGGGPGQPAAERRDASTAVLVEPAQILAMDRGMKEMVDRHIRPIKSRREQVHALTRLLFDEDFLGVRYAAFDTRTAAETVISGSGNCLSLAAAFIAMARYAGLDASFVSADLPPQWHDVDEYFYATDHTTAGVRLTPRVTATIDFGWNSTKPGASADFISDHHAYAQFYNNIAVEFLEKGELQAAIVHLNQAVELHPSYSPAWNTMGAVYKRLAQYDRAESSYRKALEHDPDNLSALNNLAVLFQHLGDDSLARQYEDELEHHRRKNPYYVNRLAEQALDSGDYDSAIHLAGEALRLKAEEHRFYATLARAYEDMGQAPRAERYWKDAIRYSPSGEDRSRYQARLESLEE